MARPATSIPDTYSSKLANLELTRRKVETLFLDKEIVRRDIEQVYRGLYMEAVTLLERSIEELFVGLLVGGITPTNSKTHPRVQFKSHEVARDVVFGGKSYVDWFPYEFTKSRSYAFFRDGHPFTAIQKKQPGQIGLSDEQKIERIVVTRNAIAHKSRFAVKRFEQVNVQGRNLRSLEKTPAGFLRVVYRNSPKQTFYGLLTAEMFEMLAKICDA